MTRRRHEKLWRHDHAASSVAALGKPRGIGEGVLNEDGWHRRFMERCSGSERKADMLYEHHNSKLDITLSTFEYAVDYRIL